jgi:pimeloyl-ACP methyl ester carboxylesterase
LASHLNVIGLRTPLLEAGPSGAGAVGELGIERAHLVVHDFGGPWAWAWAAERPGRVASVVAVNTGMLSGRKWHRLARIWRSPVRGELLQAG